MDADVDAVEDASASQRSVSDGPGHARTPSWRTLAHPVGLLVVLLAALVELTGLTTGIDRAVWEAGVDALPPLGRDQAPAVIAVDEATLDVLGPPPWSPRTWVRIGAALRAQGLDEVRLTDPRPRLIADPGPAEVYVTLRAPTEVWGGMDVPAPPTLDWLVPAVPPSLALGRRGEGPGAAAPVPEDGGLAWQPCHQRACRTARPGDLLPLPRVDVAVVPLASLLDAPPGTLAVGPSGVVLGLTAPTWVPRVPVGPHQTRAPWAVVAAHVLAAGQSGGTYRLAGPVPGVLWLALVHALVALLTRSRPWGRWLVLGPVSAGVASEGVGLATGLLVPVAASTLAATAAPLARGLEVSAAAMSAVRRLSLLVIRAASRAGTLRRRIGTIPELVDNLADLTRSHADAAPFTLLVRTRRGRVEAAGGYDLPATRFADGALRDDHPDLVAAREAWRGVTSTRLLRDGRPVRLFPVVQGGTLVGWWCVVQHPGRPPADPRRLGRLARWVGERLALPGLPGTLATDAEEMPTEVHDEALEHLFLAADEERRRWMSCVTALGHAVLVADVAGVVTSINPAMDDALQQADLPRVRSLRELVVLLDGDSRIEQWAQRMFVDALPVAVPWRTPGSLLVIRPVAPEGTGEDAVLLGFLAWLTGEDDPATVRWRDPDDAEDDTETHDAIVLEARP